MDTSCTLGVNFEFWTAVGNPTVYIENCKGKQLLRGSISWFNHVCLFVNERMSENGCDCEKDNEVSPRCAFVGDDRMQQRLDWGLLISQASSCKSIYSQISCFQTQSNGICFSTESRAMLKAFKNFHIRDGGDGSEEYHNTSGNIFRWGCRVTNLSYDVVSQNVIF